MPYQVHVGQPILVEPVEATAKTSTTTSKPLETEKAAESVDQADSGASLYIVIAIIVVVVLLCICFYNVQCWKRRNARLAQQQAARDAEAAKADLVRNEERQVSNNLTADQKAEELETLLEKEPGRKTYRSRTRFHFPRQRHASWSAHVFTQFWIR